MAQDAKDAQEGGPQRRSLRRRGVAQPSYGPPASPESYGLPLQLPHDSGEQVQLGRSGRPVNRASVPKRHPANDANCTRENWEGPGWRGATRRPSRDRLEGEPLAATGQPAHAPYPDGGGRQTGGRPPAWGRRPRASASLWHCASEEALNAGQALRLRARPPPARAGGSARGAKRNRPH
jgi:hypothetical protein